MKSRRAHKKLILSIIFALTLINFIPSFADIINYTYDDLHRLVREENVTTGKAIEYQYDAVGNRLQKSSDSYQLTVSLNDPAGGVVTSSPAGINCGSTCSSNYANGTSVTLTATPNIGYDFTGWSGACTGIGSCTLQMNSGKNVAANFAVTGMVTVQLKNSTGSPLSGGVVQYYSGGWKPFGTTDATGQASLVLPPGSYTFSMGYGYAQQQKTQNIATNPTVVFQTTRVTVQLKDSTGALMDTGTVQYYSGAWRDFGSTSGGQASKELLPGSYTFSMGYGYAQQQKAQNIATDPTVMFQTTRVTVQLKDSTGALMDTGTVQYYSGAWRDFGSTSGGQASKELLPGNYTFSMGYGYAQQQKSQNIATNPTVVFSTGQVHSDSGSCTSYYAGAWRVFTQNMELLPVTYTFRFNDGTANTSYTIISGTGNHIH